MSGSRRGQGAGVPLWPTLALLLALPLLLALGRWQLERRAWKEALLADLVAREQGDLVDLRHGWPSMTGELNFRRARIRCTPADRARAVRAGRSIDGQTGFGYFLPCADAPGFPRLSVNIGWAARPDRTLAAPLSGTLEFRGMLIAQPPVEGRPAFHLISDQPVPPLQRSAPPTLDTIPNNHLAYAVQWFGLAATLAVVYLVYLRRWRRERRANAPR